MKAAYFDCFSGASGDMILGSLIDAGLALEQLKADLAKLHLSHYDLLIETAVRKGIAGTKAVVVIDRDHHHYSRHVHHIEEIIGRSDLAETVKRKSIEVFRRLAEAEAKVHRTSVDRIHFHEVGAMDAIIDVVGAMAGLAALGIERVFCSPLNVGAGTVECAHGTLPVPAPAAAELIRGKPFYSSGVLGELLTPTGAAILSTVSSDFGPLPAMTLDSIGYGVGSAELPIPNLLRVFIGEIPDDSLGWQSDSVVILETNIDDMNPQFYDYVFGRALDMGAHDVFLTPVQMKKNRPGTLLTVVCAPHRLETFSDFLMTETTAIGLRWRLEHRFKARKTIKEVETRYGVIRCKVSEGPRGIINISPEYEDCKRAALERNIPLKEVMLAVNELRSKISSMD
jgi:uncharacterized protein (TIGR00299 family) protein